MKIIKSLFLAATLVFAATSFAAAQSDNEYSKEIRVNESFEELIVTSSTRVVFTQSSGDYSVTVKGGRSAVNRIEIDIDDNEIRISEDDNDDSSSSRRRSRSNSGPATVHIQAPYLTIAKVIGAGNIRIDNVLRGEEIQFSIIGSGDIKAESMECEFFSSTVHGSGDIKVVNLKADEMNLRVIGSGGIVVSAGTVPNAFLEVSGSGDIRTDGVVTASTEAELSGSGDIVCHATEYFDGEVSGSGDIRVVGNPSEVHRSGIESSVRVF